MNLQGIIDADLAQMMAHRYLHEFMYRHSTYDFNVSYKDMLLEVGDVGTLNDGYAVSDQIIIITSIREDKDGGSMAIQAADNDAFLYNIIKGDYSTQTTEYIEPDSVASADLVGPEINFLQGRINNKINISFAPMASEVSGWQWYKSFDDVTYGYVGNANSGELVDRWNVTGILLNNTPEYPSVVHAISDVIEVSLGSSVGEPNTTITDGEFFNEKKLCKVGDEIISFRDAVDISTDDRPNRWRLKNIIRGMLGSRADTHSPSDTFATLNTNVVMEFTDADVGRKYWIKALTVYGDVVQDIDDVIAVSDVIKGLILRPVPASMLRLTDNIIDGGNNTYYGDSLTLHWNNCDKLTGFNRGGYDIHSDISTFEYGDDESLLKAGNGVLYGSFSEDTNLEFINLKLETEAGLSVFNSDINVAGEFTFSKSSDLGDSDVIVAIITPKRSLPTLRTSPIEITGA